MRVQRWRLGEHSGCPQGLLALGLSSSRWIALGQEGAAGAMEWHWSLRRAICTFMLLACLKDRPAHLPCFARCQLWCGHLLEKTPYPLFHALCQLPGLEIDLGLAWGRPLRM